MTYFLGFVAVMVLLFGVLMACGVASAALEIRRERQAGLTPTRPAWEARDRRRSTGGLLATVRGVVKGLRSPP